MKWIQPVSWVPIPRLSSFIADESAVTIIQNEKKNCVPKKYFCLVMPYWTLLEISNKSTIRKMSAEDVLFK